MQSITTELAGDRLSAFVGVLRSGKRKDGEPPVLIAEIHEFGSHARNITARPLFRPTFKEVQPDVERGYKKAIREALENTGHSVLAHISGKIRMNFIRIGLGLTALSYLSQILAHTPMALLAARGLVGFAIGSTLAVLAVKLPIVLDKQEKPKEEISRMTNPASVLRGLKSGATNFFAIQKSKTVSKEEKRLKFPDEGIKVPRALWLYNRGFTVIPMPSWELNLPTYYDSDKSKYVGTYNSSGKITKLYPIKTAKLLCKIDPGLLGDIPAPDELFESKDIFLDNYIKGNRGILTVVKSAARLEYIYTTENSQK